MLFSQLPSWLSRTFARFACALDRRTALRLPLLLLGILLAAGRRTATAWFRPVGITTEFPRAYHVIYAVGRRAHSLALAAWFTVKPCLADCQCLTVAIDDTPTQRYGPCVQGAGIHHNPTPGPAGAKFLYGHVWVSLAVLAQHKAWGTIALPVQADLYVRRKDLPKMPPEASWTFQTKLELAAEQLHRLKPYVAGQFTACWVAIDGGYAKRPFLKAARAEEFVVVGRLRKDAALWSLPDPVRRPGQRGPLPTYGKERYDLAKRAGQKRGWQHRQC